MTFIKLQVDIIFPGVSGKCSHSHDGRLYYNTYVYTRNSINNILHDVRLWYGSSFQGQT